MASINNTSGVTTPTVGAMNELLVACRLMLLGYNVFRALSPSCPCDLAILKGEKLIRVEVTTGTMGITGRLSFPKTKLKDGGKCDLLAVVHKGSIYFSPDLEQVGMIDPFENTEIYAKTD